jgi:putative endonuclease
LLRLHEAGINLRSEGKLIGLVQGAGGGLGNQGPDSGVRRLAEDLAVRFLRRHGCVVLDRNYRAPRCAGGIDLVACQGATLVFVEIKTHTTYEYGAPDCASDPVARHAAENTARDYVYRNGVEWVDWRFDLVSVELSNPVRVGWKRDVFREEAGGPRRQAGSGGTRTGQIGATPLARSSL